MLNREEYLHVNGEPWRQLQAPILQSDAYSLELQMQNLCNKSHLGEKQTIFNLRI